MLSAIKKLLAAKPEGPRSFSGLGLVLLADSRQVASLSQHQSPLELTEHLNRLTDSLVATIEKHGGVVYMHVGGCIVAYWPPSKMPACVQNAITAATDAVQTWRQTLAVSVAVGDLSLAEVGSSMKRPVLLGAAYERAETSLRAARAGTVATDRRTLDALPADIRARFAIRDGIAEIC